MGASNERARTGHGRAPPPDRASLPAPVHSRARTSRDVMGWFPPNLPSRARVCAGRPASGNCGSGLTAPPRVGLEQHLTAFQCSFDCKYYAQHHVARRRISPANDVRVQLLGEQCLTPLMVRCDGVGKAWWARFWASVCPDRSGRQVRVNDQVREPSHIALDKRFACSHRVVGRPLSPLPAGKACCRSSTC